MSEALQIIDPSGKKVGSAPRLKKEALLAMYRAMVRTRAFDDRCMKLQRTGKIGFSVPNKGIEATSVGAAAALDITTDWVAPHYRDFGIPIFHGVQSVEMMDNMFGNVDDSAVGRQMPVHFSFDRPLKYLSISSPLGTQIPQAVGVAMAMKRQKELGICLTTFGDGSTNTLGFHSGMNFAGVYGAPVVFLCQNNGWAISCPVEKQTASEGFAVKGEAYGIPGVTVDGNDVLAVYRVVSEAIKRARAGEGPTLIEAVTFRMGGHSTSDDPSKYVDPQEFVEWEGRCPIRRFRAYLTSEGKMAEEEADAIKVEAEAEMMAAAKEAEAKPVPSLDTIFTDVYAEVPPHLHAQSDFAIGHYSSRGEGVNEKGEFPL
ncbi:MAG: thiamine pyrophosphate-dependent dehydrogenase E1 component subunit alpha [Planctomycetes bacterium]|nr:thiamine pyrophosphate-dependent dehydrogenase E1 component subunit alpha [Planctomycetota bacterium]